MPTAATTAAPTAASARTSGRTSGRTSEPTTRLTSSRMPRAERAARTEDLLARLREARTITERDALRQDLVLVNRGVAEAVAGRYRNRGLAEDDLVQVAYVGLTKAVARFDPDLGHDLLTFAVPTIRGELTRHFRDHGWSVRPPRRVQELQAQLSMTLQQLRQDLGREPTDDEAMALLDIDRAAFDEANRAYGCFAPLSLDQPVGEDGTLSVVDLLPDAHQDEQTTVSEVRIALAPVVRRLAERDQRILYLRFFEGRTQKEIGDDLGVSQVQVSRLLNRILGELREAVA